MSRPALDTKQNRALDAGAIDGEGFMGREEWPLEKDQQGR